MKFLAILEDSFREAIASYVSMVQIALTVVFVVLLASVSFVPGDGASALRPLGPGFVQAVYTESDAMAVLAPIPLHSREPFVVQGVRALDGAETPFSSYRIVLSVQCASAAGAEAVRRAHASIEDIVRRHFGWIGDRRYVEVTDVQLSGGDGALPASASFVRFDVSVRPTGNLPLAWPYGIKGLFGLLSLSGPSENEPLGLALWQIENTIVNIGAAWVIVLLGIVVTAYLVPTMLRKGAVDLLLVRPMHRVRLLVYKYASGVIYVFVHVGIMIGAVWLVLGLRSGVWKPGLLLSVPVITFFFAILYAVSALNGVVSRSAVTAIFVTCIVWFGLWILGLVYAAWDSTRGIPSDNDWAYPIIDTLHAVLPRTTDLDLLMRKVLTRELLDETQAQRMQASALPSITWAESISVSLAFIAVLLGLANWRFYRKDY
jgi:ABC-type transport system involved in multi-copper enzyme maturation permease subunit